jgi:hypothetical protein
MLASKWQPRIRQYRKVTSKYRLAWFVELVLGVLNRGGVSSTFMQRAMDHFVLSFTSKALSLAVIVLKFIHGRSESHPENA